MPRVKPRSPRVSIPRIPTAGVFCSCHLQWTRMCNKTKTKIVINVTIFAFFSKQKASFRWQTFAAPQGIACEPQTYFRSSLLKPKKPDALAGYSGTNCFDKWSWVRELRDKSWVRVDFKSVNKLNSNSAQTRLTARRRKPVRSFSGSSAVIWSGIYPDPNPDPNTKHNTLYYKINRKEKLVNIQETSKIWLTALGHEDAIKDISSKQWRNQNWDVYLNIE